MASSASTLLKIELQANGENDSTWGTKLNTALSRLEEGIADITNIAVTTANYTLDDTQYSEHSDAGNTSESHVAAIKVTGALTGNRNVIVPARNKVYWVWNATTEAFTLTVKTSSGTGIAVTQGYIRALLCDGTNVVALSSEVTSAGASVVNIVDDTTPQLGADLDANTFSIQFDDATGIEDDSGNEQVRFQKTTTAVNQIDITNAATGGSPAIGATGDDTDVSLNLTSQGAGTVQANGAVISTAGTQTIWVPAVAMYGATTNGAASASVDSGTENVEYKVLDFDTSTQEFACFSVCFPKAWNNGTVTFAPYWTAASGSGTVVFALQAVALSNDDAIDTAYGTEQTSTDTLITAADVHVGPTSSAITIAGTPADADLTFFRVKRNVADDTLGVDARLLGLAIFFTTSLADDD